MSSARLRTLASVFDVTAETWMADGRCFNQPRLQQLFFPEKGSTVGAYDAGRQICRKCPVTAECLEYADRTHSYEGMYGGLDPRQRMRRRQQARRRGVAC